MTEAAMNAEIAATTQSLTAGWRELAAAEVAEWEPRLLQAAAPLFQLPFWNEPFRQLHFTPRYLVYGAAEAYACLLTAGVPGFRIGLVQRGPVCLAGTELRDELLTALRAWARRNGYVFLRFTHPDAAHLEQIAAHGPAERRDAFPFYRDLRDELLVPLTTDEAQMLGGFQAVARRKIKRAQEVGYEFRVSDTPEALAEIWPLFEQLGARKGFRYRPLNSFLELVRLARARGCVRLHTAWLDGRPVEAILILRDATTAWYLIGALDAAALGDQINPLASPSCLLHWLAMRECAQAGLRRYHLGTRSGKVYEFKRQFRPSEHDAPPPVTWVLQPLRYRLWAASALEYLPTLWPRVKRLLFRK